MGIGDFTLANITTAENLIDGILKGLDKATDQDEGPMARNMKSIGPKGASDFADNGLQKLVCALSDLPASFHEAAKCHQPLSGKTEKATKYLVRVPQILDESLSEALNEVWWKRFL